MTKRELDGGSPITEAIVTRKGGDIDGRPAEGATPAARA
jgi:hypothetical protein